MTEDAKDKEPSQQPCLKCEGTGWVWINDPTKDKPQPRRCPARCKQKEER